MRGISKQRMKVHIVRVKKGCKLTNVGGLVGATVGFNEGEPVVGACKMHKGKCVLGIELQDGNKNHKATPSHKTHSCGPIRRRCCRPHYGIVGRNS